MTLRSYAAFFTWLRERHVPQVDAGYIFPCGSRSVSRPTVLSDLKSPNVSSILIWGDRACVLLRAIVSNRKFCQPSFILYVYKISTSFSLSLTQGGTIGVVVETLLQRQWRGRRTGRKRYGSTVSIKSDIIFMLPRSRNNAPVVSSVFRGLLGHARKIVHDRDFRRRD